MSLDVYLRTEETRPILGSGIFIRENGMQREISAEEWVRRYPGRDPVMVVGEAESDCVYHANITHNLGRMAAAAGIYQHLWRPDEIGVEKAVQLIEPLREGLRLMRKEPERFIKLNPENGWGSYQQFVPWIEDYLAACIENPDADISVSR